MTNKFNVYIPSKYGYSCFLTLTPSVGDMDSFDQIEDEIVYWLVLFKELVFLKQNCSSLKDRFFLLKGNVPIVVDQFYRVKKLTMT